MNPSTSHSLFSGPDIANAIESSRGEIVKKVVAGGNLAPTVGVIASLERLVDRVSTAYRYNSPFILYDWAEEFLRSKGRSEETGPAFEGCLRAIEFYVGDRIKHDEGAYASWTQMSTCVHEIVLRNVGTGYGSGAEALSKVDAILQRLIYQLDQEDQATAEHSRAVSLWCYRIARKLNLPNDEVHTVSRGGLIHDIGKLRTPSEILNAPRTLSPAEWEIMRAHVVQGVQIVERERDLSTLVPAVASHHERFDGLGYPNRIRGNDICIGGRITAVADSFNAMIAQRPYRKPLSPRAALAELKRHEGAQFDPLIVAAMIQVIETEALT